jgi:hypothetical protein
MHHSHHPSLPPCSTSYGHYHQFHHELSNVWWNDDQSECCTLRMIIFIETFGLLDILNIFWNQTWYDNFVEITLNNLLLSINEFYLYIPIYFVSKRNTC